MKYLLVDGDSLLFRVVAAMGETAALHDGSYAGGYLALLRSLCHILNESRAERTLIAWDGGRPQARMDLYPAYKQHRVASDPLRLLVGKCREVAMRRLDAWPVTQMAVLGAEADDLAGVACRQVRPSDNQMVLVSSDKDWLQMLTWFNDARQCHCYDLAHKTLLGARDMRFILGFELEKYLAYKSMVGDSSDNVTGVSGVGHKRAVTILKGIPSASSGWLEHPDWFVDAVMGWALERKDKWCRGLETIENIRILQRNAQIFDLYRCCADFPEACEEKVAESLVQDIEAWEPDRAVTDMESLGADWAEWGCLSVFGTAGPWARYAGVRRWKQDEMVERSQRMEQMWRR